MVFYIIIFYYNIYIYNYLHLYNYTIIVLLSRKTFEQENFYFFSNKLCVITVTYARTFGWPFLTVHQNRLSIRTLLSFFELKWWAYPRGNQWYTRISFRGID